MRFTYIPEEVCATQIDLEIVDGVVRNCAFSGGCDGNGRGLSRLVEGRRASELIPLLKDITCEGHASCPAQLAVALQQYLDNTCG
ncbi:MAG: TIGR03905 family TSCPD domain-containing protein [Clostridia bacterium]|nr:TIGR03905 family TSCPD domain-containing protein [Clostridia bacterium]